MVAKKTTQRKVKVNNRKTKLQDGTKADESENEVTKMEVDDVKKVKVNNKKTMLHEGTKADESKNEVTKMEVDDVKKDKLHKIIKKKRKMRVRRKGNKHRSMKFQIFNMLENGANAIEIKEKQGVTTDITMKNLVNLVKKRKNISKDALNATYQWEIMVIGFPTNWKGEIEELTSDYKQFDLQASALTRENCDQKCSNVLHLYFKTENDMKKALFSSPRKEFQGIPLTLRVNPVRMVYISNVPYDIHEETANAELKEVLGSGVYDITFPRNKEEKLLGHAIAYVIDEATQEELLNGKTLNLWNREQFCCTKDDFFKRFVLNVVAGWLGYIDVLNELGRTLEASDIQVSLDLMTKKLYFLDELSAEKVLQKSGILVSGRKMVFSRSGSVRFLVRNITRRAPKSELLKVFQNTQAFNFNYNERKCKATFEIPAEEVEKCRALHFTEFAGRKLEVYKCGSEEMKSSRERSRKRFEEYVVENDSKLKKGHSLNKVAKFYRKIKDSKLENGNTKSKGKNVQKIKSKKLNAKQKIKLKKNILKLQNKKGIV